MEMYLLCWLELCVLSHKDWKFLFYVCPPCKEMKHTISKNSRLFVILSPLSQFNNSLCLVYCRQLSDNNRLETCWTFSHVEFFFLLLLTLSTFIQSFAIKFYEHICKH